MKKFLLCLLLVLFFTTVVVNAEENVLRTKETKIQPTAALKPQNQPTVGPKGQLVDKFTPHDDFSQGGQETLGKKKNKNNKKEKKEKKEKKQDKSLADRFKDDIDFSQGGEGVLSIPALARKFKGLARIITKGKKRFVKKIKTCKNQCGCDTKYTPVCGASGRTHRNACLANCAKDLVVKQGTCDDKCAANGDVVLRKKCRHAPYGKAGYRQMCCKFSYNKKTKKSTNYKCKWAGAILKVESRYECIWKKTNSGKRRYCCRFERKWIGSKHTDGKRKCKFIGHVISTKRSSGCKWKQFGKYGKRKYCCNQIKTCLGKKCKTHTRTCVYKGPIYVKRLKENCSWQLKSSACRQVRCCTKVSRCIVKSKKSKKCSTRQGKCRWVGKRLCRKKRTVCQWRKVGVSGRRKRCCSYRVISGKRTKPKCRWVGCTLKRKIQSKCSLVIRKKGVKQTQCCKWNRACKCGSCKNYGKSCQFVGKRIVRRSKHKCFWTQSGKNARRRKCCKVTKRCVGKKCRRSTKCKLVGLNITTKAFTSCKWGKKGKGKKQKRCCVIIKQCVGRKCATKKKSCKFFGTILIHKQKGCKWRKHGTYGKRQYCCKWNKHCRGKKCKNTKKVCKFVGKVIRTVPKKSCAWAPYGNVSSKRKHCCKWFNYCEGKKCTPIKKKCTWRGSVHRNEIKVVCKRVARNGGKQKKCCRLVRKCRDSVCKTLKTTCKFVGKKIVKQARRACYFKSTGRFSKRKYCCRKTKVCRGAACKLRRGKCGWTGPTYRRTPQKKCKLVRQGKFRRTNCCTWFKSCIGTRCTKNGRKCSFVGRKVKVSKKTSCKWRVFKVQFRRQFCCKRVKFGKKSRKSCGWSGKKIILTKTFWKKRRVCSKNVCCFRLDKCRRTAKKVTCFFKKNVGCTPRKPKGQTNICTSWGSGHVTPFAAKTFSTQRAGDFALINSQQFSCHVRYVSGKRVVRTRAIACRVNGDVVESRGKRGNKFFVNKKKVTLKKGSVLKLKNGGIIKQISSNTFIIDSNKIGFAEASFHSRFVSVVVRTSSTGLFGGLCQSKQSDINGVGIFRKRFAPKQKKFKRVGCKARKQYVKECTKISGKSKHIRAACVFDRCRGLKLSIEKHSMAERKYVKRLPLKSCRWRKVPKRKGCKGYYCCTTKSIGRGKAKSKCHWIKIRCPTPKRPRVRVSNTFRNTGVFNHLSTGKCSVQTKYAVKRNVAILTGVAVQCKGDKFVVSSTAGALRTRLNGKKFTKRSVSKNLKIKKTHRNAFKVSTKKFWVRIVYNKHTRSLVIQTKNKSKKATGFAVNKKWRANRVKRSRSFFKKWIAFVKLSGKGKRKFAGRAKKACRHAILKKSCRRAVKRLGSKRVARDFKRKNKFSKRRMLKAQKKRNARVLKQLNKK